MLSKPQPSQVWYLLCFSRSRNGNYYVFEGSAEQSMVFAVFSKAQPSKVWYLLCFRMLGSADQSMVVQTFPTFGLHCWANLISNMYIDIRIFWLMTIVFSCITITFYDSYVRTYMAGHLVSMYQVPKNMSRHCTGKENEVDWIGVEERRGDWWKILPETYFFEKTHKTQFQKT